MKRRRQAGQALVLAAVGLTVLMLAAGLAIDMGYLRYQRRRMQSAADSAAIAGAAELAYGDMNSAAINDAAANRFTNGTLPNGNPNIQVYCLTTITETAGAADYCPSNTPSPTTPFVEVTIAEQEPLFFMRIIPGITLPTVSAKAVAQLGSGPGCMYALGTGGISAGGGGGNAVDVQAAGCTILSDGPLNFTLASHQMVAREIGDSNGGCNGASCPSGVSPAPQQIALGGNPLGFLDSELPSGGGVGSCVNTGTNITCSPGSYPNGITIMGAAGSVSVGFGSGNATSNGTPSSLNVSFQPGTYALGGNGLTITGSGIINGTVTGYGVTFYTTGTAALSINAGADYTSCSNPPAFYVGEQVQFSAPTTGTYAGVLYIQDPGDSSPSTITLGNGDGMTSVGTWGNCTSNFVDSTGDTSTASYMWGAIYAHSSSTSNGTILNLDGIGASNAALTGCSNVPRFTEIVADTINATNNINIGVSDCGADALWPATQAIPDPIKDAILVE